MITEAQFNQYQHQGYNWIPLIAEVLGDLETPLSLYLKIADKPFTYLLESGFNGESWGRYSFIGLASHTRIIIKDYRASYLKNNIELENKTVEDPLEFIQSIINSFKVAPLGGLARFEGGFVGYFGYDTIRYIERHLYKPKNDPLELPDILLMLSDQLIIYDNLFNKFYIVVYVDPSQDNAYNLALKQIQSIKEAVNKPLKQQNKISKGNEYKFSSNISREAYEAGVEKALAYFKAGDAMQLILSQRFSKPFNNKPIDFYRTLRHLNPSPYMYYLNLADFFIVGTSPEILVRLEQDRLTVRPLAGTKPRGKTLEVDKQLEKELLADEKEIAEHLMLIDLGRNDIGRVCEVGSVKVTEQMVIERFSHVMHISSTVEGKIAPNKTQLDVFKATFPAGTVSGAPKIRAMEIIDELEQDKRGVYGGAVGYLAWNGNMDLAIALRTAIIKQNTIHIQTGAGLVADSIPANEWQECFNKAKALFVATELTEQNFLELHHDSND